MNREKLKANMILNHDTGQTLSDALNISATTLSSKIHSKSEFTRKEMLIIKERYNLSNEEFVEIFFD